MIGSAGLAPPLENIRFSGPTTVNPPTSAASQAQIASASKVILSVSAEFLGEKWTARLTELLSSARSAEDLTPIIEQWTTALRRSGHRGAAHDGESAVFAILKHKTSA